MTITKEQAVQLAREAALLPDNSHPTAQTRYMANKEKGLSAFAQSIFKLGRNAGLEEARQATIPHSDVIAAARAIESLKDNTP